MRGCPSGLVGGWQLAGIDGDDRPAVHRHAADRRQQRRAQLAESDRLRQARQPDRGSLVQSRRLRRAAAEHLRRLGTRASSTDRATPTSIRRCRSDSPSAGAQMRSSGGMCSTCSITPASASRMPRSAIHGGTDHDDHRGQPEHAVGREGQFLAGASGAAHADIPLKLGVCLCGGRCRCRCGRGLVAARAGQPATAGPMSSSFSSTTWGGPTSAPMGARSRPLTSTRWQPGVCATQFYVTPRCSPSRASLLTGLYPHQAGMGHLDNIIREGSSGTTGRLNDRSVTIAEVLREAG